MTVINLALNTETSFEESVSALVTGQRCLNTSEVAVSRPVRHSQLRVIHPYAGLLLLVADMSVKLPALSEPLL